MIAHLIWKQILFVSKLRVRPLQEKTNFVRIVLSTSSCHDNVYGFVLWVERWSIEKLEEMETAALRSSVFQAAKFAKLDWNSCLYHMASVPSTEPLTVFRHRSWKTLLHAASVRNDRLHAFSCDSGAEVAVPQGVDHCTCYQTYTHK